MADDSVDMQSLNRQLPTGSLNIERTGCAELALLTADILLQESP